MRNALCAMLLRPVLEREKPAHSARAAKASHPFGRPLGASILGFPEDLQDFLQGRLLEIFAPLVQDFDKLDGSILHVGMGFGRSANQKEMVAAGEPLMAVLVV